MTLADRLSRLCANTNCERSTDWPTPPSQARYCKECTRTFLATGSLPVIAPRPEWLRRLSARDNTGSIVTGHAA
jgi:hypothetical protein